MKTPLLRDSIICAVVLSLGLGISMAVADNTSYIGGNGVGTTTYVSGPSNPTGTANGLPVQCISGCTGGSFAGAVFGPTAVGSAAANPGVLGAGVAAGGSATGIMENFTVKAPSTAALSTDTSLVMDANPGGALAAILNTGIYTAGSPPPTTGGSGTIVGGTDGTNAQTFLTDTSGRQVMVGAGTAGTPSGGVGSVQGVTGGTPIPTTFTGSTTGGDTPYGLQTAASTNSTLVSTGAHSLKTATLLSTSTTVMYLRLYDTSAAPTCSSATGFLITIPIPPASASGLVGGIPINYGISGLKFSSGLSFCVTGGATSTDATNATTGGFVNFGYQ